MKRLGWLLAMFLLILTACSPKVAENYETIGLDEIHEKIADGFIVLDVREVDEFAGGHIIGAVNMPLSELQKGNRESLNSEEGYIVICRSGNRSKEASDILFEEGYDVINVSEGMSSWTGEIEH